MPNLTHKDLVGRPRVGRVSAPARRGVCLVQVFHNRTCWHVLPCFSGVDSRSRLGPIHDNSAGMEHIDGCA